MLCDDLGVGGRLRREGAYVYIELKLIQHCKEVVLQLKGKQDNPLPTPARYLNGPSNLIGGWGSETGRGGILKVSIPALRTHRFIRPGHRLDVALAARKE